MKIQFLLPLTSQAESFGTVFAIGSIVPEIVLIYVVIAIKRLRRKPENAQLNSENNAHLFLGLFFYYSNFKIYPEYCRKVTMH
jgi:hypothetical protein